MFQKIAKHRANDASHHVHHIPLVPNGLPRFGLTSFGLTPFGVPPFGLTPLGLTPIGLTQF